MNTSTGDGRVFETQINANHRVGRILGKTPLLPFDYLAKALGPKNPDRFTVEAQAFAPASMQTLACHRSVIATSDFYGKTYEHLGADPAL